jgi:glycosyltransferase involved in cell wall biosynthesis
MNRSILTEPRISVVIPAFNRERTIGRAIGSVLSQSYQPSEIIVVDDGSTDGTAEVVSAHGGSVRCVSQANAGASAARNRGVELATAPWVAFLDSDDHWLDGHLEHMAAAIAETDGAAGFYFADTKPPSTATVMWGSSGFTSLWDASGFIAPGRHLLTTDATGWVMQGPQPMMLQSTVFSRDRYLAAGGLRPELRTRHDTHLYFVMGIGQSACAVAGGGVQMTADDQSGCRLTESFGPETRDWLIQSRMLYADVLRRFPELGREHRSELKDRLASTELQLGRDSWRSRAIGAGCGHVARAMRLAPLHVAGEVARKAGRVLQGPRRRRRLGHSLRTGGS